MIYLLETVTYRKTWLRLWEDLSVVESVIVSRVSGKKEFESVFSV